jgi:hypothetical protein
LVITAGELALMRAEYDRTLQDTCVHQPRSASPNPAAGQDLVTFSDGATLACGFDPTAGKEQNVTTQGGAGMDVTVVIADARLRLPMSSSNVKPWDRIKLTHRMGEALAVPFVFDVIGPAELGQVGVQLNLRAVQV